MKRIVVFAAGIVLAANAFGQSGSTTTTRGAKEDAPIAATSSSSSGNASASISLNAIPPPPSMAGPELGKITKRPDPTNDPEVVAFYSNANKTCSVTIAHNTATVTASEYWADVTFRETLTVFVGSEGFPLLSRTLQATMTYVGMDVRNPAGLYKADGRDLFLQHCQLAVNRDIPQQIKARFHPYLGIQ